MPVTMEWESRLGRRLRVRDLYILTSVVKSGSMAKAARRLSMSQPAVSEAIANLEHLLGVRLLDRAPHGVTPTAYADAMLKRSIAIFDEMTESVRDVEFLADPATGRVTIGCPESVAATLLPLIAQRFGETYPRVVLQVEDVASPAISSSGLRERRIDLLFARWPTPDTKHMAVEELNVEQLFDDPVVVAAGAHARWAHRHRVRLEELAEEWWVMSPPGTWNYEWVARAFKDRGLGPPKLRIATYNAHLNTHFLKNGPFLTSYPRSWVKLGGFAVVPVDIPLQPMPLSIVTLKNRTLSPAVGSFIGCVREVAKSFAAAKKPALSRSKTEVS
ncbi:MAG TPA: LysR family transcriptional regulator [Steroidobacteraceae bacterium]